MTSKASLSSAKLQTKLPYPLYPLAELAFNLWWSWSTEHLSIFRSINADLWEQYRHNPVQLLHHVSPERLAQLATDPYYCKRVADLSEQFEQYMQQQDTWASRMALQISSERPVAYFSFEYGFYHFLPTYFNSYRRDRLPQNLTQAQRDYFGSHTYQRNDQQGTFHTEWTQIDEESLQTGTAD